MPLNFFDLDTVTVLGVVEYGGGTLEFPIRIERGVTEPDELADLLKRTEDVHEKTVGIIDETRGILTSTDSLATPTTQNVVDFLALVTGSVSEVERSLVGTPDESQGAPKTKFKPKVEEAGAKTREILDSLDGWSQGLFITPQQAQEADERAVQATARLKEATAAQTRELHRLRAERIAFWCPDWEAKKGEETVKITADHLEKRSPELLILIEEEIAKKAPRRSVLL